MNRCKLSVSLFSLLVGYCLPVFATDYCPEIQNSIWTGGGEATGTIKCSYKGEGQVNGNAPNYLITFHAKRSRGSTLCPQSLSYSNLKFECVNNEAKLVADGVVITGTLTSPTTIQLHGELSILGLNETIEIKGTR